MNEHLPECFALMCECDEKHFKSIDCDFSCICPTLRACEQRVNSSNLTMWDRTQEQAQQMVTSGLGIAWKDGFKEGINAAREAITNLPVAISSYYPDDSLRDVGFWRSSALAAIDELREKR